MRAREVLNCQMNLSEMSGEGSSFNGQHSGLSAWLQIGAQEWGIPGASWPSKHERKNMERGTHGVCAMPKNAGESGESSKTEGKLTQRRSNNLLTSRDEQDI